jgi:hypothetical protein
VVSFVYDDEIIAESVPYGEYIAEPTHPDK